MADRLGQRITHRDTGSGRGRVLFRVFGSLLWFHEQTIPDCGGEWSAAQGLEEDKGLGEAAGEQPVAEGCVVPEDSGGVEVGGEQWV